MIEPILTQSQLEELDMLCIIILKSDEYNFTEKKMNMDILFRGFCRLHNLTRAYSFDDDWFVENKYIKVKLFDQDDKLYVYYYDIVKKSRVEKIKSLYE